MQCVSSPFSPLSLQVVLVLLFDLMLNLVLQGHPGETKLKSLLGDIAFQGLLQKVDLQGLLLDLQRLLRDTAVALQGTYLLPLLWTLLLDVVFVYPLKPVIAVVGPAIPTSP